MLKSIAVNLQEFWQTVLLEQTKASDYLEADIILLFQGLLVSLDPLRQHGLPQNEVRGFELLHYQRHESLNLDVFLATGAEARQAYFTIIGRWLEMVRDEYTLQGASYPVDDNIIKGIEVFFRKELFKLRHRYSKLRESHGYVALRG